MAKKKILWIEDDEDLMLPYRLNLEKEGWQVKADSSAEQGKSIAVTDRPDLIIMDIAPSNCYDLFYNVQL